MKLFYSPNSLIFFFIIFLSPVILAQNSIEGRVMDKKYKEPLTGAAILIEGTTSGTTADIDGNYKLTVAPGKYTLVVSYVSYNTQRIQNVIVEHSKPAIVNIDMEEVSLELEGVLVVAQRRTDTELSMLNSVKAAVQIVNGISSQQIGKTLDRDASEIIKRVPGITIQDNRFVVVRGLNQRYNNVWLNNAATPSSETDVKAFSFDAIPSNMIDNLLIYKTGSPELSAEATGGFIKISTKNIPDENFLNLEYGIAYNDVTTFEPTFRLPGYTFDFLGLGSTARNLPRGYPQNLSTLPLVQRDVAALQLSNRWETKQYTALPNQKLSVAFGKKWNLQEGARIGNLTSMSYTNNYSTRSNMENNMYERFDPMSETPTYLYRYNAGIYSNEYRLGLLHNWAYQSAAGTRIEFKNMLNQMSVDRSANTYGWNNYRQGNFLYYSNQYSSRTVYSGQLSGNHKLNYEDDNKLDWNIGFAYANRLEPDRQNRSLKEVSDGKFQYMLPDVPSINELGRLYMTNHEFVSIIAANYENKLLVGNIRPTLKTGIYNEFKTRNFVERSITYRKAYGPFDDEVVNAIAFDDLFTESYLGHGKIISVDEQTNIANSYYVRNLLSAAYFSFIIPVNMFNINGGVRAEYNRLMLNGYYNISSPVIVDEPTFNLFPSINATFNFTAKTLLQLAYAHTINRPEFREVSPLSYYDFTEKNSVRGNPDLKDALIQNVDLRIEHYPTPGETYTLAAFYKNFRNPIEMVSVGTGNEFSFENALGAINYGLELEIKKSLETLIGLKNFSLNLNASYIFSKVEFENTETERSRPLQGQSPYVVNAGIYYQSDAKGWSSSLMYNVTGKRIMVAAQLNQGEVVIPDIYEKPRNVIDFSFNKKIGKNIELKFGVKDILSQPSISQQTYEYSKNGENKQATLNNKVYYTGRTYSAGIVWKL